MIQLPPVVLLLAALVLGGIVVLAVALFSLVHGPRARLRRRIAQVAGPAAAKGKAAAGGGRRRQIQSKLKAIEANRQKTSGWQLRERLAQTGLPVTIRHFILGSLTAGLLGGLAAMAAKLPLAAVAGAAIVGGLGLPRLLVGMVIKRRLKAFTSQFADAIDVIVRGIRSGLPVGECLNIIGREFPDPVGNEFRLIVEAQRLGLTIDEALVKAQERVPTAELRYFAIVLGIQQSTGGNLAETLAKLSEVLRGRKRMRDKIAAMSSEAKASAGIIGSLPILMCLLLSVVAPKYIGVLFTTETGHLILAVGIGIMGAGVFVMRQMINFDI